MLLIFSCSSSSARTALSLLLQRVSVPVQRWRAPLPKPWPKACAPCTQQPTGSAVQWRQCQPEKKECLECLEMLRAMLCLVPPRNRSPPLLEPGTALDMVDPGARVALHCASVALNTWPTKSKGQDGCGSNVFWRTCRASSSSHLMDIKTKATNTASVGSARCLFAAWSWCSQRTHTLPVHAFNAARQFLSIGTSASYHASFS